MPRRRMRSRRRRSFGGSRRRRSGGFRRSRSGVFGKLWTLGTWLLIIAIPVAIWYNFFAKSFPKWYPKFLVFKQKGSANTKLSVPSDGVKDVIVTPGTTI